MNNSLAKIHIFYVFSEKKPKKKANNDDLIVYLRFFCFFAKNFKILNMVTKDLKRLKLVLVEKK